MTLTSKELITNIFEYNQHFVAMMNVINAARLNPPESGHKHHIIPRCWFNTNNIPVDNSKDNIVLLTYEDHCKVHKLAYLCAKTPKMRSAMALAAHRLDKEIIGCPYIFTAEHRKKLSEACKGRKHSDEAKRKMSESLKGRPGYWKGKHLTDEVKRQIGLNSASRTKEARERVSKQFKGKHRIKIDGKWRWV
jgi:hypothetical protein